MSSSKTFTFAEFELDVAAYALRRRGQSIRLERRPMDLLILLVERRRELVSRQEIVERLWAPAWFVEVETGINTAIRKVRQVLGDTPDAEFIETVSGRGYRFVADVEVTDRRRPSDSTAVTLAVLPFENLGADPSTTTLRTVSPRKRPQRSARSIPNTSASSAGRRSCRTSARRGRSPRLVANSARLTSSRDRFALKAGDGV